jgi:autotransporter-associated beta strand protein
MVLGENTIGLRVTDDAGNSVTATTTVSLNTLHTYVGPGPWRQNDRWNQNLTYWSPQAVPSGAVDVLIPDNKGTLVWNALTPTYTGNLYMGVNSSISIGWTNQILPSYNAIGTPGKTTIFMDQGSRISTRMAGYPTIPAIQLTGDASFSLGESTQGGADASFNYGINGPHKFAILGNRQSGRVANLNTPNTFSELDGTGGGPAAYGGCTVKARAPGSLGTGNVTIGANNRGECYAFLEIWAEDAMADTATLSIDGDSAIKLWMYANDTIASLIINGKNLPGGTYGSVSSDANNKVTWIGGDKVLTVTDSASNYWDNNGSVAGAGGATPSGTWDGSTKWTSSASGTTPTSSWISGSFASFSAGDDATGAYNVTVGAPAGITVTKALPAVVIEKTPAADLLITEPWAREGGNTVAVLISAINATGFTATYAGLPMTVNGVYESGLNSYSGIAYIISDSLPATGDVVINMPYDSAVTGGGYARFGYAYSILSLSGVASAGTPVSKTHSRPPRTSELTYATTTNNAYVLSVASDSDWHNSPVTIAGQANEILFSGTHPGAYYNTLLCHGSIAAAGTYTDAFGGSPNNMITLPFEASTASNPLFGNQKIAGLSFENGTVTLNAGELELQGNNPIIAEAAGAGIINTHLSGVTGAGITKRGAGTVTLGSTANDYPGGTNIVNGTLRSGDSNVLPVTSPIYIGGDTAGITGTLDLNGKNQTIPSLTLGGGTTTSAGSVITSSGTLTLDGDVIYNSSNNPLGATISGKLALGSSDRLFTVQDSSSAANDLTISAVISGSGGLTKRDFGTLYLTGNNSYTGLTSVSGGLLALSGNNSAATGGITVNNGGAVCFESLASINGSGQNVKIEAGGLAYFGSSFDSGSITSALARFDPTSTGAVAVDNFANADFNFGSLDLSLGALDDVTYGGVLSPGSGGYRIGGGPGTITFTGENAFTGSNSLIVAGRVIITNANNLSGTTTILPGGRLQIGAGGTGAAQGSLPASSIENNGILAFNRTDVLTPGTDFKSPISGTGSVEQSGAGSLLLNAANTYEGGTTLVSGSLILGNATAIGTGPLSLYSGLLDVDSAFAGPLTLTGNNPINLSANFTFGGTENLNLGSGAVNIYGSPTITLNGDSDLTLAGLVTNGSGSTDFVQTLTVNGSGNTLVLGGYDLTNDEYATNINLVIDGTADVVITGPIDDLSGDDAFEENYGGLIKTGTGTLTLYGDNKHTGDTVVESGVLQIESGTQKSPITVNDGGILGFTLGSPVVSTESLTLSSGHMIRITGTPVSGNIYDLMTGSFIVGGAPTLETLITGWKLVVAGNVLQLAENDTTPPLMLSMVDDRGGSSAEPNTLITYTVTFNEEINTTTVDFLDFDNAGTATITIDPAITKVSAGIYTLTVTPTTTGTLQLRIPTGSSISDIAGNPLTSDPALLDDTIIQIKDPYDTWAAGGQFDGDTNGDGIANGLAWLLGAFDVNEDATSLLPVAEETSGALKLSFTTLNSTGRGTASVKVQYSTDLGAATWASNQAEVPDVSDDTDESGIDFVIVPLDDNYIFVEATIPASAASPSTTLFARVSGSETAPPE